ncbi:mechanosensitive ion channel family protein [Halobacteriales archaeon QS_1_68_20]|nr:MAG: mechanosensitive ion channel family protein [Halobacteriales archaeon QS_1_68_20]
MVGGPLLESVVVLQSPTERLGQFVPSAVWRWLDTLPGQLFGGAVVVFAGWYLSKLLVRYLGRPVARRFQRPSITRTVLRGVRSLGLFLTAVVALNVLGVGMPEIVLSGIVFSAVVGIVLAPIIGSIINGLFVLADQPYEVGDMIALPELDAGARGFVEDITLRYTKVFTLDNTFLVIPNSVMRERDVFNFSAEDERTRLSLELLVTYEGDLEAARSIMERAARDVDEVITGGPDIRIGSARYPAGPTCYIGDYADHGVLLVLRYWAKRPYKIQAVRSKVNERVWAALEAEPDVEIAYPHQHLVFDEHSGEARVRVAGDGTVSGSGGETLPGEQQEGPD